MLKLLLHVSMANSLLREGVQNGTSTFAGERAFLRLAAALAALKALQASIT